jgi:OOP family OmpA-OmpF porin
MKQLIRFAAATFILWPSFVFAQEVAQQEVESSYTPPAAPSPVVTNATKKGKKGAIAPYVSPYYKNDDDKDGVPNGRDKCPFTPQGEKVTPFGCPYDTDFDGLYDFEDKCPTEPGPR